MQCPKCDGVMARVYDDDVRVDRCDNCHGLYFDQLTRQDLALVANRPDIDTGDEEKGAEFNDLVYVDCPKCDRIMDQRLIEEPVRIRFEICTSCYSTFLDAGEFRVYLSDAYRDHFTELLPEG
jgi:uncharacterized protein